MNGRRAIIRNAGVIMLILSLLLSGGCFHPVREAQPNMRTITDCTGRQVQIPAQVNRIACLCPEAAYALAMLGQGDKIVAVVNGVKRDQILTDLYPRLKDLPVPKSSGVINIEELVGARPDLVFVKRDTSSSEAEVDKLNKTKIPFLVVDYNSMQQQQNAVAMIGQAVGAGQKAQRYNQYYQDCIQRVQQRVAGIPARDRIRLYHSLNEATRTDIKGSLSGDWTQASGVINVAANQELKLLEGKYYASLEQILLWNPDVILVNESGVANYILTNRQWSPLKAVQNRQVYQMPNGLSRWGHPSSPETPLAILWTAKTVYPDRFSDLDMSDETRSFYKTFFDLTLSDEDVKSILYGEGMRSPRK